MPVFEPEKSKIKMVILTKSKEENLVWWSPLNQNRRRSDLVIKSMLRRLENHPEIKQKTNVIQFYENRILIATYRP